MFVIRSQAIGCAANVLRVKRTDPPIELEPKSVFSWKIVGLFALGWVIALVALIELRWPMLRILMPLLAVMLLAYLTVCTVLFLKNRK